MRIIQKLPSHRPELVVRVGFTGSNLKELEDALQRKDTFRHIESQMSNVLDVIRRKASELGEPYSHFYSSSPPKLRLIFAPTGGLEFLIAGAALDKQSDFQLILPFAAQKYSEIFFPHPSSDPLRSALDEVLEKASAVVELDGSPGELEGSLESASQTILRQCDVLVVIWTGDQKSRTGQTVREALSRDMPVVWIHTDPAERTVLYERSKSPGGQPKTSNISTLTERFKTLFLPPKHQDGEHGHLVKRRAKIPFLGGIAQNLKKMFLPHKADSNERALTEFLAEEHPKGITLFRKFRHFAAWGWKKNLEITKQEWLGDPWLSLDCPNGTVGSKIKELLNTHFERADNLANAYGDLYRSFFLITYGLGALAVLSAFCGIYLHEYKFFIFELAVILAITALVLTANYYRIHQRWIDYRLLGEGFRQMQFLAPLARVTPAFEVPAHLDHDDPGRTWFNWYFRAIIREAGMISVKMDPPFLERYREVLAQAVNDQVDYHAGTGKRMELIHHRLHRLVAYVLFPATLVACLLHLEPFPEGFWEDRLSHFEIERIDFFLSLGAIILPALGAAIEGIIHQGEFDRIDKRSQALRSRLKALCNRLTVTEKPKTSKDLGTLAEYFCQIQILEQADWRAAFVSKPLSPP